MTESRDPRASAEPGITMTRVFDAPRERIWKEWAEPERFADWFGGPDSEIPLSSVSMEVREGGRWRATMYSGPQRRESRWEGEYLEVIQPERLVFKISDRPGEDLYELVIVVLNDLGDGRTEMHFEQRGHMAARQYERAKEGWGTFFDLMAERLVQA
jgi:uncharacterized protein YndB with AHSA1/START domain